jgi:hypothetical protein
MYSVALSFLSRRNLSSEGALKEPGDRQIKSPSKKDETALPGVACIA